MLSDVNRKEVREEGNLLIEAVSLLVQRQRETESWIAEQIWQAEERATASERMYAEFEARLAGIEEHLARLVHDVEPPHDDLGVDQRLERLREQVEGLKSGADARPPRLSPAVASAPTTTSAPDAPRREPELLSGPRPALEGVNFTREVPRTPAARRPGDPRTAQTSGQGVSFWQLLGPSPEDRFGFVLIAAGAVAVLYAILSQLRFG